MLTSSTQLQNRSFCVVERTRRSVKCPKMKTARGERAKLLLFIIKYANLWRSCCRRRRALKLPICTMVTILQLLLFDRILSCWQITLKVERKDGPRIKCREFTLGCSRCLKLEISACRFADYAKKCYSTKFLNYVAHVQHDSFSSFNQSVHCFLVFFFAVAVVHGTLRLPR